MKVGIIRIGVHNSIKGGICNAIAEARVLHTNTLQLFLHSPRSWRFEIVSVDEARSFRNEADRYGFSPVIVHSSYLLSPLSDNIILVEKTIQLLYKEVRSAELIGADYYVMHVRENKSLSVDENSNRLLLMLKSIDSEINKVKLLIENSASGMFSNISNLMRMADVLSELKLFGGVCLDTAHLYQGGYDIKTKSGIEKLLGELQRPDIVKLIHLNDSKTGLGSFKDMHEHISMGKIGVKGFRKFFFCTEFYKLPIILETPRQTLEDDVRNLMVVKRNIFGIKS